ncbi:MAG: N-acetylglucosamine-6-phosphate deacetylase [Anaerolineaceae bacterium]
MTKSTILLTNIQFIDSHDHHITGWINVEGSKIKSLGQGQPKNFPVDIVVDGQGLTVLPGLIDLHTHGAKGNEMIGITAPGLQEMTQFYASHGVTGFLASTWTAPQAAIRDAITVTQTVIGNEMGAKILGIHLEGPWLNVAYCGAQEKTLIRTASRDEALELLNTDLIRLVAVAPELPENEWLIRECTRRGITVAAGHTNATYAEMQKAVAMGVSQVTHCFNAMRPLNHREPGVVGAAFDLPQIKCELIADNIHVNPVVMKLLMNVKGPENVILISDSIMAAGMPNGEYSFEGATVTLKEGAARLADGTLAGSTLTMERALANIIKATGRPLGEVINCASLNPARAIHIEDHKGQLRRDWDADLILVDQNLQVKFTMVEGKVVYKQF